MEDKKKEIRLDMEVENEGRIMFLNMEIRRMQENARLKTRCHQPEGM